MSTPTTLLKQVVHVINIRESYSLIFLLLPKERKRLLHVLPTALLLSYFPEVSVQTLHSICRAVDQPWGNTGKSCALFPHFWSEFSAGGR